MGRKSSRKKIHKTSEAPAERKSKASEGVFAAFLIEVVRWGACIALFAPLIVHSSFFFPFVVPKATFFWICAEIVFAAWLLLALSNKQFRPTWNPVSIAVAVFLLVTIVTSFAGINIERSFWSTFERMAGTINWIHLALFFFALSSTFRTRGEWRKLLAASFVAATIVASIFLLQKIGISIVPFDTRSGATIGNSSFMAAYLLFNVFFGFWLAAKTKDLWQKSLYAAGLGLIVLGIFLSSANGAIASMIGGFLVMSVGWLFFAQRIKFARLIASVILLFGVSFGALMAWGVFTQNRAIVSKLPSFFSNTGPIGARKVVWDIALKGIKERPILGWGPENFNVVFAKYFNPCMVLSECGGEVWFDRTHNIIFDNLINSGILGLLSYLSIFSAALYMIGRKFQNRSSGGEWILPSVIVAALASYFVQNLLVFDMPSTYIMFSVTLALVAGILGVSHGTTKTTASASDTAPVPLYNPNSFATVAIGLFLFYYLFSFGFQTFQAANLGIRIVRPNLGAETRIALYKKSLSVSPVGHSQTPEFFTDRVMDWIGGKSQISKDFIVETENAMAKSAKKNSKDFRDRLILANFYSVAHDYDEEYLKKAEQTSKEAIALSPRNQQGYIALAQAYLFEKQYDRAIEQLQIAVNLEVRYARAYSLLGEVYKQAGQKEKAEENLKKAEELGYKTK